jgi:hypothetical protein
LSVRAFHGVYLKFTLLSVQKGKTTVAELYQMVLLRVRELVVIGKATDRYAIDVQT